MVTTVGLASGLERKKCEDNRNHSISMFFTLVSNSHVFFTLGIMRLFAFMPSFRLEIDTILIKVH